MNPWNILKLFNSLFEHLKKIHKFHQCLEFFFEVFDLKSNLERVMSYYCLVFI